MIEIKDLSLTFKNADEDHEALKAVTLDIPEGCIYGFVGSNGAGKSTTMNILTGYISATAPSAAASPLTNQRSMTGRRLKRTSSL